MDRTRGNDMDRAARTWKGDWRARIFTRIRVAGCETLARYLAKCPATPYMTVARILGDDVAAAQVARMHIEEAKAMATLREAAMDSLPRDLNYYLPEGWRHGAENDFETSRAFAVWATRLDQLAPDLKEKIYATWESLEKTRPPVGWKPAGASDPLIMAAFAEGWPP